MNKQKIYVVAAPGQSQVNIQQMIEQALGSQVVTSGFGIQNQPQVIEIPLNAPKIVGDINAIRQAIPFTSQVQQLIQSNPGVKYNTGTKIKASVVEEALKSIGKNLDISFEKGATCDLMDVIADEPGKEGSFVKAIQPYLNPEEFAKYKIYVLANLGSPEVGGGKVYTFKKD